MYWINSQMAKNTNSTTFKH